MDKIQKFLQKLTRREREIICSLLLRIQKLDMKGLHPQPLQGFKDLYRIRKGKIRIVYAVHGKKGIIVALDYRKDVYKDI